LRNVGRWDWSDVVDAQIYVGRRLLRLLRFIVALLLECSSDRREDGLKLRLKRLG